MSERESQDREPISLEYRDAHRDGEQLALWKMAGGCVLTLFVTWLSIFTGAAALDVPQGAVAGGLAAIVLFVAYAAAQHRRGRARAFVAGIWIGTALGLLLTGFCSALR